MTDKKLTVLGIVAIAMVILVGVQSGLQNKMPAAPTGQGYLLQGLSTDAVATILIGVSADQVILTRTGTAFTVVSASDYPAKTDQVNDLLTQCLDIKTLELITSNPANHAEIGVTEDTARYVLRFADADSQQLAGLLISETNPNTGNAYAKLLSSDDVYAIANVPWLYTTAGDYIEKLLLNVDQADIESVTVTTASGDYTLIPGASGEVTVADIPAGVDVDADLAKKVFTALANLRFTEVQTADAQKLDFINTYKCTLKDTTVYTVSIARRAASFFIKCDADFMDKTQVKMQRGVKDTDEELKAKEAKLLANQAADKFDKLHTGWVYELPAFQAENMTKNLSEMLKEKPKLPKPQPEAGTKRTDENHPLKQPSDDISENLAEVEAILEM
ncbi:MAG: DUF4340 domain-containing protein [Planctomycetes bacterium]|nr:DUF4340 domain-containing protein [Planctomycetota bacterium]